MGLPVAILNGSVIIRILRALEKRFHQIDGIVEVPVVHIARVDMDLALELRPESFPVVLQDVAQVVMLTPIRRDGRVDHAGPLVPDRPRVAVLPDGTVDSLPDIVLIARAAVRSEDQLEMVRLLIGREDLAELVLKSRSWCVLPGPV